MKRALAFILLGPALIALEVLTIAFVAAGPMGFFAVPIVVATFFPSKVSVFLFVFLISATAGLWDGYLARIVPIRWRAPLTATIASSSILAPVMFSPGALTASVINHALCAGLVLLPMAVCSLLSHNYSVKSTNRADPPSSLS